jgi:hypothetical protein
MRSIPLTAIIIFFIILISGCINPTEPKYLYQELTTKGQSLPNGKFVYNNSINIGSFVEGGQELIGDIYYGYEIYSFNGRDKTILRSNLLGVNEMKAVYHKEDMTILCTEGFSSSYFQPSEMSCAMENDTTLDIFAAFPEFINDHIDDINISLGNGKSIAGRECYEFISEIDPALIRSASLNANSPLSAFRFMDFKRSEIRIYLDKEYGFLCSSEFRIYRFSQLENKEVEIFGIYTQLQSFDSSGATGEDVKVPVDFLIDDVECTIDGVILNLTAVNDNDGEIIVKLREFYGSLLESGALTGTKYHNVTRAYLGRVNAGEKVSATVATNWPPVTGYNDVAVCKDENNCVMDSCYFSRAGLEDFCEDSDGGQNYLVKGTVRTRASYGRNITMPDSCYQTYLLAEYYCIGDHFSQDLVTCHDGCNDGVCLSSDYEIKESG